MSENSTESTAATAQEPAASTSTTATTTGGETTDWQAEATRLRDELAKARKWEDRAKESHAKVQQYEREKLPEAERAAAEAEERGRAAAQAEFAKRLVRSDIRAEAAAKQADLTGVFEYLDLSRFVGEDGEPDSKAIAKFVESLPTTQAPPPSFDGGTRKTVAPKGDMNSLIRKAAGLG